MEKLSAWNLSDTQEDWSSLFFSSTTALFPDMVWKKILHNWTWGSPCSCRGRWVRAGPDGYPRVLDYSIFEITTLPYSKNVTTRSSSRVVTISSFLSDHSNIQKIEMWNFQTLSWGLFSPVLIAAEAVQYSSTSFSPQAAPPPTAVPAALNTSWQFLLAPTGALYVVMHH